MRRGRRRTVGATIAALLAVPTAAGAAVDASSAAKPAAAPTVLVGEVGPGYTITLKRRNGTAVRRVRPGLYTFVVRDRATNHDFRLRGPGLGPKLTTGVPQRGTKRWTVRLRAGRYVYLCTPHPLMMRGVLIVR